MTKYDEIMEKITLSPEARDRIIENVADEISVSVSTGSVSRKSRGKSAWRKYLTAAACCILVAAGALAASGSDVFINLRGGAGDGATSEYSNEMSLGSDSGATDSKDAAAPEEAEGPSASEMTVPMESYSLADNDELSDLLGFDISCQKLQEISEKSGLNEVTYNMFGDSIGEIVFGDGEHGNWFRKSSGTEDISGDYSEYSVEVEFDGERRSGTLKGDLNDYKLAVWTTSEGYTYAAFVEEGLTDEEWQMIIDDAE